MRSGRVRLTSRQSVDPVTTIATLGKGSTITHSLTQAPEFQAWSVSEPSYILDMRDGVNAYTPDMSTQPPERLTFPCDYPIKVMVRAEEGVRSQVDAIIERHAAPLDLASVVERPSGQRNFLGITYVIRATSAEQIAQLFAALKLCEHVLLVL
jgi:putative lipoic acid-binding regulatory protein